MKIDASNQERQLLFNQSLEKGLAVLNAFDSQHRTMNLAEIAQAAGINKSSAQRMVYTLEQLGYIRKHSATRRFQLTAKALGIGFSYLAANALVDAASPFLAELVKITSETCNLTEPDGLEMVYVTRFVCSNFVPVYMPIGSRIPMYCTASGRAWLSALPEPEAYALILKSERIAHTVHTRTGVNDIMDQLSIARERGFALNAEELYLGDMTVAAPVLGKQGRPVAAVHVVAPTSRWSSEQAIERLAPPLLQCARALGSSARLAD